MNVTDAQRWVLSMGAILREINGDHHDLLAGHGRGSATGAAILASWWGIRRRSELHAIVGALLLPRDRKQSESQEHPAWDWLRAANLAAWGYDAWMQSADEAWAQMCLAARHVQQTYRSFREVASDYIVGYLADNGKGEMGPTDPVQAAVEGLLARGGLWQQLAWDTPLDEVPAPVDVAEIVFARPGEPIADVLERARARIDPSRTRVRVELAPGTYPTAVRWDGALELVATGDGVILQGPDDGPAIRLAHVDAGLRVEGARLCAGAGAPLAVVAAGLLRLERCALSGDGAGIEVQCADAAAQLVGCTVEGFATGLRAIGGHTELEDTRFARIAAQAVRVDEDATVFLGGCRLEASAGQGVIVDGDARIERTRFERLGQVAIEVKQGSLVVDACELFDCNSLGLQVHADAVRVQVRDTAFRRAGTYAVQLQAHACFHRCRFEDSRMLEAVVWGCGAELVDCVFQGSMQAAVYVTGQHEPVDWDRAVRLERCLIRDARTVGVLVLDGGAAVLSQVEVIDCVASAVEVRTGGALRADDCTWRGKGTRALLVHERGAAMLADCRLAATVDEVIRVTTSGTLRLEGCQIEGAPQGVILTGEAMLEAIMTEIEGATEQAGLIVSEGSRARIIGGALRRNREVAAYVQEGALATFSSVEIEGADLYVVAGGCARLDDCTLRGSDEAGINVDNGYLALVRGEISGATYSGIEVRDGGRARVIGASIQQTTGEAAVYAHDGGEVLVSGGTWRGGRLGAIEVTRGARARLSGTELLVADGAPRVLAHDGGLFEEQAVEQADIEREQEWQMLARISEDELVPGPEDEEELDEDEDLDEDEVDEDEDDVN